MESVAPRDEIARELFRRAVLHFRQSGNHIFEVLFGVLYQDIHVFGCPNEAMQNAGMPTDNDIIS